jgi:hypothetical protein
MRTSCRTLTSMLAVSLLGIVLLSGCEGPQGPAGAIGADGATGAAGPQGPTGQDANENCVECHDNSTLILSRQLQYMNSKHANGGHSNYGGAAGASYYAACARCHTNEGFVNHMNGDDAVLISNATPINCRGCHLVHVTGTESDLALRSDDPVTLDLTEDVVDYGTGNLCVNCHQPRTSYEIPDVAGTTYDVASSHFGPHYGVMGAVLSGLAGYDVAGSVPYMTNLHIPTAGEPTENGCVSCHMAEATSNVSGGHTMVVTTATCADAACHTSAAAGWDDFDYNDFQTWVGTKQDELEALLITNGALNADGSIIGSSDTPNTLAVDIAGALWNYRLVYYDHSHGVHNPRYIKALLTNSIEALTP